MTTRRIIPLTPATGAASARPCPNARSSRPRRRCPWCAFPVVREEVPYCDFNSHAPREGGIPEQAWLGAVLADLW